VIRNFTITVDNNRLGYSQVAYMGVNLKTGFRQDVTKDLAAIEDILEIHEMYGKYDLLLKIRAKDLEDMRNIVENKISRLPYIARKELMTVLRSRK
jgi:Lrp/AsnC family transcriptional regulator, regulator for asnA, asnC and gidA